MTPTLILSPRYTPDSAALWKAALELGWSVERLSSYRVPEYLHDADALIYGEGLFASIVAESLSIALLEPPVDWLTRLPYHYLQRAVRYTTLSEIRATLQSPLFVKPGDGGKGFDAKVYAHADELPSQDAWEDATPVIVSEPVIWETEYRCFLSGREGATLSVYTRAGEFMEDAAWSAPPDEMADARAFCAAFAHDDSIALPPGMVLDVGKIAGKGWAVIEANPAYAAGIYGCDPIAVLKALEQIFVKYAKLSDEHRQWFIRRPE
jgi:hypothetical protein